MKRNSVSLVPVVLFCAVANIVTLVSSYCDASEANDISLREYVDVRFEAQEKAVEAALASADRAVQKAEAASDKRFESVNEFRAALDDSGRLNMPRTEAEQQFRATAEKIDDLTKRLNARDEQGRGLSSGWAMLIAAVGLIAVVWAMFFKGRTQ